MVFYHVTHKNNIYPVLTLGLEPTFSPGKQKSVWLVTASRVQWAIEHVSRRTGLPPNELVVFRCAIPRRWLMNGRMMKTGGKNSTGLWRCNVTIPPCKLSLEQPFSG